jgi:hypothetical protein
MNDFKELLVDEIAILQGLVQIARAGRIIRTATSGSVIDLLKAGDLFCDDHYWQEGMKEWERLAVFPGRIITKKVNALENLVRRNNTAAVIELARLRTRPEGACLRLGRLIIGRSCFEGFITRFSNPDQAVSILRVSAKRGCPFAKYELANCLRFDFINLAHHIGKTPEESASLRAAWRTEVELLEQSASAQGVHRVRLANL